MWKVRRRCNDSFGCASLWDPKHSLSFFFPCRPFYGPKPTKHVRRRLLCTFFGTGCMCKESGVYKALITQRNKTPYQAIRVQALSRVCRFEHLIHPCTFSSLCNGQRPGHSCLDAWHGDCQGLNQYKMTSASTFRMNIPDITKFFSRPLVRYRHGGLKYSSVASEVHWAQELSEWHTDHGRSWLIILLLLLYQTNISFYILYIHR